MEKDIKLLGMGAFWDDLSVGDRFRTVGRTLTETDLVVFVNLSWLTEELFTNTEDRKSMAIAGRVVPAAHDERPRGRKRASPVPAEKPLPAQTAGCVPGRPPPWSSRHSRHTASST